MIHFLAVSSLLSMFVFLNRFTLKISTSKKGGGYQFDFFVFVTLITFDGVNQF